MTGAPLEIVLGDCREVLRQLPEASVHCCVTSPPYWGLRNYGHPDQLGQEKTPADYVASMVSVFAEVWRVLRDDGTAWLNLGDSYIAAPQGPDMSSCGLEGTRRNMRETRKAGPRIGKRSGFTDERTERLCQPHKSAPTLKTKDLCMIPARVAIALQDFGWYLRSEITWCKKVPMPESVRDRPTSATEKIFLLSKSKRYFYDADAVRNPPSEAYANDPRHRNGSNDRNGKLGYDGAGAQNPKAIHRLFDKQRGHSRRHVGFNDRWDQMEKQQQMVNGSNLRNWWLLGPEPFLGAHFATFPTEVPRRCILAGCPPGGVVLDPFGGSGTTGKVALELGRRAILIELNPDYVTLIKQRCDVTLGLPLPA